MKKLTRVGGKEFWKLFPVGDDDVQIKVYGVDGSRGGRYG